SAVRGAIVSLDGACREILDCHPYPPALRRVLSELLAAATLLASTLKFKGALIVQLQGDGPVRLLVVESDAALSLRATAQWKEAAADDETWARAAACVAALPSDMLLARRSAPELLHAQFPHDDVRLFKARPARFACSCSEERVANALRMIGRTEVETILAEQGLI